MHDGEGRLADGALYYRSWSASSAIADVVLAHGYAEHSGRYDHVATALAARGLNVWAIDHRGHGQSQGDRGDIGSWESVVSDLNELVDLAAGQGAGGPMFLVGHSLGGAVSIAYALAHQDRLAGLSLSAPAIKLPAELLALAELPEIPPLSLAGLVSSDPAVVQAYADDPLVYLGPPPANLLLGVMATVDSLVARLPELTLPIQIMHGSADALIPSEALKMVVEGVSSTDLVARLWPGLFHEIFNEPTDGAVVGSLVDWVSDRVR
jgi:alpha-beta hydrolase superfamily lysophospholipase